MRKSTNTESAILGSCLIHGSQWWDKVHDLGGEINTLFYERDHRLVAEIFDKCIRENQSLSQPLVADLLHQSQEFSQDDVQDIVHSLVQSASIVTSDDLSFAVRKLSADRSARELNEIAENASRAFSEDDATPEELRSILEESHSVQMPVTQVPTMRDLFDEMESKEVPSWAVPVGLRKLDECLDGGWEAGKSYVIAASAKVGKSTMMFSAIERALSAGAVVMSFSLETIKPDFMNKMLANVSGLDRNSIIKPFTSAQGTEKKLNILKSYDEETRDSIVQARAFLRESKLYAIFESDMPKGFDDIAPMIASVTANHPHEPVVVFVDHLGLLVNESDKKDTRQQLEHFTKSFATIARNNQIAIVMLAQINRNAGEGEPSVSHLRGSGSIEQDANSVILLHRNRTAQVDVDSEDMTDNMEPNEIIVHLALNRSGQTMREKYFFDGAKDIICDLDEEEEE